MPEIKKWVRTFLRGTANIEKGMEINMSVLGNLVRKQGEAMIENLISPGDKLEMKSTVEVVLPDGTQGIRTYKSSVHDVRDDGLIEIMMPIEHTKLVLLPVDGEYDVCFFSRGSMYRANVRIVDREKINGNYVLVAEMISNLHKFQRREYYRYNCILEMMTKEMTTQEIDAYNKGLNNLITSTMLTKGVIVDISGGGIRFVSRNKYEKDSILFLKFGLPIGDKEKNFELVAKVICSDEIANRKDEYANRIKFIYIDNTTREEIIKFIFDEERKNRKNGKGR